MTVIRFDSVTCDYEGRRALGPVTVELSERRIGIIGPNGGGKSTFVRLTFILPCHDHASYCALH